MTRSWAPATDRRAMRDAAIATSRTRSDSRPLLTYRPRPASWGDTEGLAALRRAKAEAAARGADPSLAGLEVLGELTAAPRRRGRRRTTWPRHVLTA